MVVVFLVKKFAIVGCFLFRLGDEEDDVWDEGGAISGAAQRPWSDAKEESICIRLMIVFQRGRVQAANFRVATINWTPRRVGHGRANVT